MLIEPMREGEEAAVVALWDRAGLTRPWNDAREDIAFARRSGRAEILVGREDGRIVAALMVGHDGHRGAVYYVAVDPGLQGQGRGRALMEVAEAWLRQCGVWKLNLLVRAGNEGVKTFYEAIGFEAQPRIYMERWLDEGRRPIET